MVFRLENGRIHLPLLTVHSMLYNVLYVLGAVFQTKRLPLQKRSGSSKRIFRSFTVNYPNW